MLCQAQEFASRVFWGDYPGSRARLLVAGSKFSWLPVITHIATGGLVPLAPFQSRMRHDGSMGYDSDTTDGDDDSSDDGESESDDDDSDGEVRPSVSATGRSSTVVRGAMKLSQVVDKTASRATGSLRRARRKVMQRYMPPVARFAALLGVPGVKFVVHNFFGFLYIFLFAVGLCGWPWHSSDWIASPYGFQNPAKLPPWEWVAWVWNVLRFIEELEQFSMCEDAFDCASAMPPPKPRERLHVGYFLASLSAAVSVLRLALVRGPPYNRACGLPGPSLVAISQVHTNIPLPTANSCRVVSTPDPPRVCVCGLRAVALRLFGRVQHHGGYQLQPHRCGNGLARVHGG